MRGLGTLLRAHLRRDRWMLPWWVLGVTILYYSQAVSVDDLYSSQAELDRAAASMEGNTAFVALSGPARALNTIGGQVTWQAAGFGAVVVGLMSMFLVGRHTRAEEETGRDELVRASGVDRAAPLTAALVEAALANVVLGALVAASLASYPLAAADSLALGVGLTLCGWFFAGTAAVAAQLTVATRSMYGVAGSLIALAYVLRAVGDVGNPVLSWLTPIGWYQAMHAFSGLRWWPAALLLLGAAAATGAAYLLAARRDLGSGLLAARPGPARAGALLGSSGGLALRLHRGPLLGWSAGLFLTGLAYGSIGDDVGDLVGDSSTTRDLLTRGTDDLVTGFYATSLVLLALVASGFAISSTLRPRAEEEAAHLEALLATALPRRRWLLGHVAATALGTVLVLLAAGLGLAAGFALVTGDAGGGARLVLPTVAYAAPVLVLSGLGRLLYGLAPRAMVAAWVPLVLCVVVLLFGEVLRLPSWLRGLSPFEHLAAAPAEAFRWTPFLLVALVAATLSAAGQLAFARRDVH